MPGLFTLSDPLTQVQFPEFASYFHRSFKEKLPPFIPIPWPPKSQKSPEALFQQTAWRLQEGLLVTPGTPLVPQIPCWLGIESPLTQVHSLVCASKLNGRNNPKNKTQLAALDFLIASL